MFTVPPNWKAEKSTTNYGPPSEHQYRRPTSTKSLEERVEPSKYICSDCEVRPKSSTELKRFSFDEFNWPTSDPFCQRYDQLPPIRICNNERPKSSWGILSSSEPGTTEVSNPSPGSFSPVSLSTSNPSPCSTEPRGPDPGAHQLESSELPSPYYTCSQVDLGVCNGDRELDSYTIARLLREDGFRVQQVFLVKKERECVIVTNCEESAKTIKEIRTRLEAQKYSLFVRPVEEETDSVEFLVGDGPNERKNFQNSECVLVLESKSERDKMTECGWTTNTIFLREPSIDGENNLTTPEETSSLQFYCISTFHIFRNKEFQKYYIGLTCSDPDCECEHESLSERFEAYWDSLWKQQRCTDPDMMAKLLQHLNRLIEEKQIALSLVRQDLDREEGQRIEVKYIVAANYQVVGSKDDAEKHLLDGILLKLDDEHVSAFCAQKFSVLSKVQTGYKETRVVKQCLNRNQLFEQLVCSCRSMLLSDIDCMLECKDLPGLDYRRAIFISSHSRVLGMGQSGSPLLHLSKNKCHADLVGFLQRSHPLGYPLKEPRRKVYYYVFVPINEQLEALLKFNKRFPLDRPVINELVLP